MRLPKVTHVQFLVLDVLVGKGDTSATRMREALRACGDNRHGPAFYQLMQRLQREGAVESWSQEFDVGGGEVRRTFYRITSQGRVFWRETLDFYTARIRK